MGMVGRAAHALGLGPAFMTVAQGLGDGAGVVAEGFQWVARRYGSPSPYVAPVAPPARALIDYPGYRPEELAVFEAFAHARPRSTAGFVTDFIGSRSRLSDMWDGLEALDGVVLPPPVPSDYFAEAIEWIGMLKSVLAAKGRFVAMELGAGMGPWIVAGAVAAGLRGITDIRLTGVEADPGRFLLMANHLRDNGIDPDHHSLLQCAVGVTAGTAHWPRIADPRNMAGGRPMPTRDDAEVIDVRFIPFEEILCREPVWDLVHMDVQGGEAELCIAARAAMAQRVRYFIVGTHSRLLDGQVMAEMHEAGWILENEKPARMIFTHDAELQGMTTHDGTQVWRNPRL